MINSLLADLIVIVHLGFILFVVFGGLMVLKRHKLMWLHLTAVVWGALIEFYGWLCPLTHLENNLRPASGGYDDSFIEYYIMPLIYPAGLTREIQVGLGIIVILLNFFVYRKIFLAKNRKHP